MLVLVCWAGGLMAASPGAKGDATISALKSVWNKPARTYKPHTRWWWPGNALTKADITWQLEQMAGQGIGGVEIMSMWKVYEKGNVDYLTPEFLDLVKHTVAEAKRLDLEVAITFSPGWGFGGSWVPKEDQSKVLCLASKAQSDGLSFIHKRVDQVDIYFVCNLQPKPTTTEVAFRVTDKVPQRWDAITGETAAVPNCSADASGTTIPLDFEPWESVFFVFAPGGLSARLASVAATLPLPEPFSITGLWAMKLEGYGFEAFQTSVTELASWTEAPRTRHFSGTGRYEIEFTLPAEQLAGGPRVMLDLGRVGTVAEVELNGQHLGVAWMAPYRLDVTKAVRTGKNRLVVFVTNTLINYVSGLKEPPEVPVDLQPRLGKANPAIYPEGASARQEMSETDLPASGLIGPVRLVWK